MKKHKKRHVIPVENKISNIFLKTAIFLIFVLYTFFLTWSGISLSLENIPILMLVVASFSLWVITDEFSRTKKGFQVRTILSVIGITGCLIDTYRVYDNEYYIFDAFSFLIFIFTLLVFLSFIPYSYRIYKNAN